MKIAYVCYKDEGKYVSSVENEDEKLLRYLQDKGLDIHFCIWTDPNEDWSQYQLILIKSPWDYFDKIDAFNHWLDRIRQLNIRMLNPLEMIRWNSHKRYLLEIGASGLPVVETLLLEKNTAFDPAFCFNSLATEALVFKPAVSGGSKNTFRLNRESAHQRAAELSDLLKEEAYLVQPYRPEIAEEGEWSFLFFGGVFSHALLKTAKSGDFRVQHYLGGSIHPKQPTAEQVAMAGRYVESFAAGSLYARVDGVFTPEGFQLMELELIEPFLFLFTHPQAYENYYQALLKRIHN